MHPFLQACALLDIEDWLAFEHFHGDLFGIDGHIHSCQPC